MRYLILFGAAVLVVLLWRLQAVGTIPDTSSAATWGPGGLLGPGVSRPVFTDADRKMLESVKTGHSNVQFGNQAGMNFTTMGKLPSEFLLRQNPGVDNMTVGPPPGGWPPKLNGGADDH